MTATDHRYEDDAPEEGEGGLAPGWGPQDVDVLDELVSLGMQLARNLCRNVAIRTERAEDGREAPMSEAEIHKARLDFVRLARAVRFTLNLKAHVLGAPHNPTRLGRVANVPPAEIVPYVDPEAPYRDEEVRLCLEHAVTDPAHSPAEVERLREGIERWLETEHERERFAPLSPGDAFRKIARDLGLEDRVIIAVDEAGVYDRWILARPSDDPTTPIVLPDEPPWNAKRHRTRAAWAERYKAMGLDPDPPPAPSPADRRPAFAKLAGSGDEQAWRRSQVGF